MYAYVITSTHQHEAFGADSESKRNYLILAHTEFKWIFLKFEYLGQIEFFFHTRDHKDLQKT